MHWKALGETQKEMDSPSLEACNYQLNESLAEKSQRFKNNNNINNGFHFQISSTVIRTAELGSAVQSGESNIVHEENLSFFCKQVTSIVIDHLPIFHNLLFTTLLPGSYFWVISPKEK